MRNRVEQGGGEIRIPLADLDIKTDREVAVISLEDAWQIIGGLLTTMEPSGVRNDDLRVADILRNLAEPKRVGEDYHPMDFMWMGARVAERGSGARITQLSWRSRVEFNLGLAILVRDCFDWGYPQSYSGNVVALRELAVRKGGEIRSGYFSGWERFKRRLVM